MATTIIMQSPPFISSPNPTAHNLPYQEDDHLDTLSLRDLPITTVDHHPSTSPSPSHQQVNQSRRSSSDPTSDFFFEFLINNDDDLIISSADDVIFRGRLLPFAPPPSQPHPRRSLSLSSRITPPPHPTIRPSKSLNYRKLNRNQHHHHHHHHHHHRSNNSKPKQEFLHRNSCNNNNNNNSNSEKLLPAKSPWNWLVFGLPKIPAEMELKDIKNRQFRRNLTTSKSLNNSGDPNNNNNNKSCSSSASWKFLNVLSCKSHATVDVYTTAPFRSSIL